MERTSYF